jgi:hypothetical protein
VCCMRMRQLTAAYEKFLNLDTSPREAMGKQLTCISEDFHSVFNDCEKKSCKCFKKIWKINVFNALIMVVTGNQMSDQSSIRLIQLPVDSGENLYLAICPQCGDYQEVETRCVSKYAMVRCCGCHILKLNFELIEDEDEELLEMFQYSTSLADALAGKYGNRTIDSSRTIRCCEVPLLRVNKVLGWEDLMKYELPEGSDNFHDEPYKKQLQHIERYGLACGTYDVRRPVEPYPNERYVDSSAKRPVTCLLENGVVAYYN